MMKSVLRRFHCARDFRDGLRVPDILRDVRSNLHGRENHDHCDRVSPHVSENHDRYDHYDHDANRLQLEINIVFSHFY